MKGAVLAALALIVWVAKPALSQTRYDVGPCLRGAYPDDRRILICTQAIDSGQLSKSDYMNALLARSAMYFRTGQRDPAFRDVDRALELEPTNAFALANRGSMRAVSGDAVGALRDLNEAARLSPNSAEILLNRGSAYASLGQYDLALRDFDRVVELRPGLAAAYRHRGHVFLERNQPERALKEMETAVRLEPGWAGNLAGRSRAKRALGDVAGADADLAAARNIDPKIGN